jgi:hypothetical protein
MIAPERVAAVVEQASSNYHVIGAMSFGEIPVGHSVVMNVLRANPDSKAGDVYDVGMGKFGLTGNFLNALADAAGVSVVGSNLLAYEANYCVVETTVARMGLDGTVRRVSRRKVMDLREGSGQLRAMRDAAKAKSKDSATQVREQRLRIAEHADSKAALRAIRAILSVRTYTPEELKKPFAVFKLQFTGRTNDPQLKQVFAIGLMQASLGAMGALYGAPAAALPGQSLLMGGGSTGAPQLGAGPVTSGARPVDMGDGIPDEDDPPQGGDEAPPRITAGDSRRIKLPGKSGKTINDAEEKDLVYWEKRMRGDCLSGKWDGDQYAEKNMVQLLTIRKEMRYRKFDVEPCPELDGDDQAPARVNAAPREQPQGRPPSDRGAQHDSRTEDQRLADAAFGPDERSDHDRGDDQNAY